MKTNIPLHAGMEYLLDTGKHEIIAVKTTLFTIVLRSETQ